MPLKVAALYQFAALPDFRELREPLRALAAGHGIKGSVLLAHEGINGTVAGGDEAIDAFVGELQHGPLFGGRLDNLELKFSSASEMPFQRLKVRLKKEIVTLGDTVDPTRQVGTYVEPSDWNALIAAPDTLVIDTRNAFEVAMGTFEGADRSRHQEALGSSRNSPRRNSIRRSTARSRCSAPAVSGARRPAPICWRSGFGEVYHLKGGILRYLEGVPEQESRWRGECFVFDERVALGHGLRQRRPSDGSHD